MSTRFAPGPATAYVADDVLAVTLDGDVDGELMTSCSSGMPWSELLECFAEQTDAAVAMHTDGLLRVGVIGGLAVTVAGGDGEVTLAGDAVWTTHELRGVHAISICSLDVVQVEPTFCVDGGAVPVSIVARRLGGVAHEAPDPFECLFGATVHRSVEAAAIRPEDVRPNSAAPLGVLVFSTGERVVADRAMLLGRNPLTGHDPPDVGEYRRVTLADPAISRRHAVIRTDRWHLSIDDLGSSNGTRVTLPGMGPMPITPGDPHDLVPGSVVELGGVVSFAVEEVA